MSNVLGEVISAFSALFVTILAYVSFGPLINDNLSSFVQGALVSPEGALLINANALYLTLNIILMGWKVFVFFLAFAIFARLFIWVGFIKEEQGVY